MNNGTQNYKDLLVWQKGVALAKATYNLTKPFPSEERFGLIAQMRRAAVSIPSNIAEGQARRTTGEFVQLISHAEGSCAELDTQLILSVELAFCRKDIAPANIRNDCRRAPNVKCASPKACQPNIQLITDH
jgi:four helix bundle protein